MISTRALLVAFAVVFSVAASAKPPVSAVYCPLYLQSQGPGIVFRTEAKSKWRQADEGAKPGNPDRRVKLRTNLERRAGQRGGLDESADPAPPFTLGEHELRPAGMPPGTYWSNSGRYFYRSDSIEAGLHGGPRATERFEFVYMYQTPEGKLVEQSGGYAAPNSSWGWDGRFELQPVGGGKYQLVVTQGAMELPTKMRGAHPGVTELPEIARDNASRSRHIFKPLKFENGKLYLVDQGSILGNVPDINGDWISFETVGKADGTTENLLTHAHGYGENFLPLATDPRKMATDEYGYPIRIFDMVTAEVHIERDIGGTKVLGKEPATTRSIAYRMDPKDPSKRVARGTKLPNGEPADAGIVVMAEDLPENPGKPLHSTLRMKNLHDGNVVEVRTVNMDGTVSVDHGPHPELQATLVEGFNPVPAVVTFPSGKKYYLGTFSASEYTAGALNASGPKEWRYGSYLGYRPAESGALGRYRPVTEIGASGPDFADTLEDFTELYGLSWGAGRPQAYQDEAGRWWMDVHFVDTDLVPSGLPTAGYPPRHEDFADAYRRHKASLPIRWTERNGQPWLEIDDPEVFAAIEKYRAEKRALH
jgi:hypothetical protein